LILYAQAILAELNLQVADKLGTETRPEKHVQQIQHPD
jgi:hypothetical protein